MISYLFCLIQQNPEHAGWREHRGDGLHEPQHTGVETDDGRREPKNLDQRVKVIVLIATIWGLNVKQGSQGWLSMVLSYKEKDFIVKIRLVGKFERYE